MIRLVYPDDSISITSVKDYPGDDASWASAVALAVYAHAKTTNITLVGCSKDHTSFYLTEFFSHWRLALFQLMNNVNATDIRAAYFGCPSLLKTWQLPPAVSDWLIHFASTDAFKSCQKAINGEAAG